MIALDIHLLNLKSPYYVVQDADGDLLFETDYGVKYGISFELNEGMMNYPAYEFGILNKNGQPSPNDRKLRDTIVNVSDITPSQFNSVCLHCSPLVWQQVSVVV